MRVVPGVAINLRLKKSRGLCIYLTDAIHFLNVPALMFSWVGVGWGGGSGMEWDGEGVDKGAGRGMVG